MHFLKMATNIVTRKRALGCISIMVALLLLQIFVVFDYPTELANKSNDKLIDLLEFEAETNSDLNKEDVAALIGNLKNDATLKGELDSLDEKGSKGRLLSKIAEYIKENTKKGSDHDPNHEGHNIFEENFNSTNIEDFESKEDYYAKERAIIIKTIFSLIASANPDTKYERNKITDKDVVRVDLLSENALRGFLEFDGDFVDRMKRSHAFITKEIRDLKLPHGMYSGSGIVMVGGGKYSILCLSSIAMMRKNGGDLPVEVIIPDKDSRDDQFCNELLPELNGKCIYLQDLLGQDYKSTINVSRFQYKGLALLASSFDNLLLLDSDNLPVHKITADIFTQEPYKSSGMVVWPDFWRRTTSPVFYDIAGVNVSDIRVREGIVDLPESEYSILRHKDAADLVPFHDRKGACPDSTSESGQLMISKTRHADVLLLSLYYISYGPDGYYDLLSQSAPGSGDKDTFAQAATVLGKEYYGIKARVQSNGYTYKGKYSATSMMQHDPLSDYKNYKNFVKLHENSDETFLPDRLIEYVQSNSRSKVLFMHTSNPKLYPVETLNEHGIKEEIVDFEEEVEVRAKDKDGKEIPNGPVTKEKKIKKIVKYDHTRLYHSHAVPEEFERELWILLHDYLCVRKVQMAYTSDRPEIFGDDKKRAKFCEKKLKPHMEFLINNHY